MIVLLTGAAGFVGRQVLHFLLERGVTVRAVVRDGHRATITGISNAVQIVVTPDLFAESDLWWAQTCCDVEIVLHVAWYAEPGKYLHSAKNLDCLEGTLKIARGAAQAGVRRLVGIGTCFEYDLSGGLLSIDTPIRPSTPYAGAKAAAFMALSQWLPEQNVEFAWCRLFYLHGSHEDPRRLVSYIRRQLAAGEPAALTTGTQVRDFLDVTEAGRLVANVALGTLQGPINICSGVPMTVRALAEHIADEYGLRDLLQFGSRADNLVDPATVVGVQTLGIT